MKVKYGNKDVTFYQFHDIITLHILITINKEEDVVGERCKKLIAFLLLILFIGNAAQVNAAVEFSFEIERQVDGSLMLNNIYGEGTNYRSISITYPQSVTTNIGDIEALHPAWQFVMDEGVISIITNQNVDFDTIKTQILEELIFTKIDSEENFLAGEDISISLDSFLMSARIGEDGELHFYQLVNVTNRTWLQAYNEAKQLTYRGLTGYLATITSEEEHDFIFDTIAKLPGWLGGTRALVDSTGDRINGELILSEAISDYDVSVGTANVWYWADGPEAGTDFWNGISSGSANAIPGVYAGWNTNEPNNAGNETMLQFAYGGSKNWNDLSNGNLAYENNRGYYVEFSQYGSQKLEASDTAHTETIGAEYNINFNSNGGSSINPLKGIITGNTIVQPTAPIKTGNTFAGWYKDAALTDAWDFATDTATENITLYAKWECTVVFDSNGGSVVSPLGNIASGNTIVAPVAPTKTGNTFAGWYKDAALTDAWEFDTDMVTQDITLYAKWDVVAPPEAVTPDVVKPAATTGDTANVQSTLFTLGLAQICIIMTLLYKRKYKLNKK